jgi:hypothetical protein
MGIFTPREVWLDGFYTLVLDYSLRVSLEGALRRLWSHPSMAGCYLDRNREPADQSRVDPSLKALEAGELLGVAGLPGGRVPCLTCAFSRSDGSNTLELSLPMASLRKFYCVGIYPFSGGQEDHERKWQEEVDTWFTDIAQYVSVQEPFRIAVIGFEILLDPEFSDRIQDEVPVRHPSLLRPAKGGLEWYPQDRPLAKVLRG